MVPTRRIATLALLLSALMLIYGCGQKGPLYREAPSVAAGAVDSSGEEKSEQSDRR